MLRVAAGRRSWNASALLPAILVLLALALAIATLLLASVTTEALL